MKKQKAFTLAEVLITLSILGVVAAITIPSVINHQSDMAALVKMKKSISQFEKFAETYMIENDTNDLTGLSCDYIESNFKIVEKINNYCATFKTADGVVWFLPHSNFAMIFDSEKNPKFSTIMWVSNRQVDSLNELPGEFYRFLLISLSLLPDNSGENKLMEPKYGFYNAIDMLRINNLNDVKNNTSENHDMGVAIEIFN